MSQCTCPGGVVFASCSIARAIQRQVAASPQDLLGLQLISSGRALLESLIAVASEHESCGPPDVDFGDHEYTGVTCRRLYVWMYISTNQLSLSGKPIIQQAVYEGGEVPALLLILKTPANSPFDGFSH